MKNIFKNKNTIPKTRLIMALVPPVIGLIITSILDETQNIIQCPMVNIMTKFQTTNLNIQLKKLNFIEY